ncbi:MAG: hypothetical protein SVO01_06280 [Thermotogota bacterium]|nr:hypothetical protein [Thermotogota bacterium]
MDWLKIHQDADEELYGVSYRLCILSEAFLKIGNTIIGDELLDIVKIIERCRKEMCQAVAKSIKEAHSFSQVEVEKKPENIAPKPGESCGHPGCLQHVSHPCEGCGRIAGRRSTHQKGLKNGSKRFNKM